MLDRKYSGLVIATSSRFYAVARPHASPSPPTRKGKRISIRAGQFPKDSSVWEYDLLPASEGLELKPVDGKAGRNKFVHITVAKAIEYAYQVFARDRGRGAGWTELDTRIPDGFEVVVLADNDFYSQREQVSFNWSQCCLPYNANTFANTKSLPREASLFKSPRSTRYPPFALSLGL